ncbi:MAG: amidohydrolase family protein [Phycisphaerales bacterium]|nr:amidohydrolase family protein [Phycisphaerales bacterium]
MNLLTTTIAAAMLATACASAQDLAPAAPAQDHPIILIGATVHTVSGDNIENGAVAFTNGRIEYVGQRMHIDLSDPAPNTQIIDLTGKHIYPGLIDSVTRLGLEEISAVRAMNDYNEVGDMTPEVRAYVSVNPDSTVIPTAQTNGVLTVGVFPSGGTIPGRASVLRTNGWTTEDMAISRDAGVIINWPRMRAPANSNDTSRFNSNRDKRLAKLDTLIDQTISYAAAHNATDLQLDAMTTILPGESQNPVYINADDYDQITTAVNWAISRGLRPVIVGGRDAHLCTDLLASTNTPVIVGGTYNFPKRNDAAYDEPYTLPAKLEAAGVKWSLTMSSRHAHERNLPDAAAIAVAHGLDHDAALRAITLTAAENLGVADQLGSIEQDKLATLIITDADILDVTTIVEGAYIDGRKIDLRNKQTDLRDKYLEKYRQLDMIESED